MFGGVILTYVKCSKLAEFFFKNPPPPISKTFQLLNDKKKYSSKFKFFQIVKGLIFYTFVKTNFYF